MKKFTILTLLTGAVSVLSAQETGKTNINGGIRIQKSVGFYYMNGLTAEINSPKILKNKLTLGVNLLSSRLGSAFMNNGIGCHEFQVSAIRYFRPEKHFKPLFRLNTGIAWSAYGSDVFRDIPRSSALLSLEPGIAYDFSKPVRLSLSLGYNMITGSGDKGYGMLWPVFIQFSGMYRFSGK